MLLRDNVLSRLLILKTNKYLTILLSIIYNVIKYMKKRHFYSFLLALATTTSILGVVLYSTYSKPLLASGTDKTYTFNKDHQYDSSSIKTETGGLGFDQRFYKDDDTFILVWGSGKLPEYETYNFNSDNNFIESTQVNRDNPESETILMFNVKGMTSITWNISMSEGYGSAALSFLLELRTNRTGTTVVEVTNCSLGQVTIPTGNNVTFALLQLANYGSLAINYISFNYNCVGV